MTQLANDWNMKNLDAAIGDEALSESLKRQINLGSDSILRIAAKIDNSGKVTYYYVDTAGKIITDKDIPKIWEPVKKGEYTMQLRDSVRDVDYFIDRYDRDKKRFNKVCEDYNQDIVINNGGEKFDLKAYHTEIYLKAFLKLLSSYSLGLSYEELLPDAECIVENICKSWNSENEIYGNLEKIFYLIIIFDLDKQYITAVKTVLQNAKSRDRYLDILMKHLDPTWEIESGKLLWLKEIKPLVEVIEISETDKAASVVRLKKFLEKEWFKSLKEGIVTNQDHLKADKYRGYWCLESAALVKMLELDDTELLGCTYYPADMAHF